MRKPKGHPTQHNVASARAEMRIGVQETCLIAKFPSIGFAKFYNINMFVELFWIEESTYHRAKFSGLRTPQ